MRQDTSAPRRTRPGAHASLAALLALLAACTATPATGRRGAPGGPDAVPFAPENAPRFQALQGALRDGEDELAAAIVAELRERPLTARENALLDSADRVLGGRALVRTVSLALVSEPAAGEVGRFELVLVARCTGPRAVRLMLPPCDLKRLRATMDARGVEGFDYESRISEALRDLRLAPDVEQRIPLVDYELPLGRALATRERWRLETRSGEIECDGAVYPAARVGAASCARERLAPLLAQAPVASAELARMLAAEPAPSTRALLEIALRIPAAEREAALAEATPVVANLAHSAPARVAAAEPALRWLTHNRELGPDAAAWARYLEARLARGAPRAEEPRGGLDLPAPAREPELGGRR